MSRRPRTPTRWIPPAAPMVAVVLLVALVAAGCSWGKVRIDVDGVDARWVEVPGADGRRTLVVTAEDAPRDENRSLVVVVHGLGQDAEEMATFGGWSEAARDNGFVVAYADGLDKSFDAGTCCGPSAASRVDDVSYLDDLITTVTDKVGADPQKVYMVGFSNGGMMTYRYLCEGATRLRGAASLAGTNVSGCTPNRPTPFLQVTGAGDQVVPVGATPSVVEGLGPLVPSADAVRGVADAFDCPAPKRSKVGAVTSTVWAPCAEGISVRFDVVAGLVHTYPIVDGYNGTDVMLQLWGLGTTT